MLSVCGYNCGDCEHLSNECNGGCEKLEGKVYCTTYVNMIAFPIFTCVNSINYNNCGDCSSLPCSIWSNLKDPSMPEDKLAKSITERINKLRAKD